MHSITDSNYRYRFLKALKSGKGVFVVADDESAIETVRKMESNQDLYISPCFYDRPDLTANRTHDIYFVISSGSVQETAKKAVEACYWIIENIGVPEDCLSIICNCRINPVANANSSHQANEMPTPEGTGSGCDNGAEITILVSHIVFGCRQTPAMPLLNYLLAIQIKDMISEIDVDVYHSSYMHQLPNSKSHAGRYAIPMTFKELVFLDHNILTEMLLTPRSENSLFTPYQVPEVIEFVNNSIDDAEHEISKQQTLCNHILKTGWQISPCIRRLMWADLSTEETFEACHVISQFFSLVKAGSGEILYHIDRLCRRNNLYNNQRIKPITKFAVEHPYFVGCGHLLLKRFCPVGKCFMAELIKNIQNPILFPME